MTIARFFLGMMIGLLSFPLVSSAQLTNDPTSWAQHCQKTYEETKVCPSAICRQESEACIPKSCSEVPGDACPENFCRKMVTCTGQEICSSHTTGFRPACGDVSYADQEVECCEGLVPRCGVEFLDASCDLEGKPYSPQFPLCIPCGDGVCGQFENRCNCPEDCGVAPQGKF